MKKICLYTDGSCIGNIGDGGWAFLMMENDSTNILACYGYIEDTTNNRMEMIALLNALTHIENTVGRDCEISVYTDSRYIEGTVNNGWLERWINESFSGKKNIDLWVKLYGFIRALNIKFYWVKGHGTNPFNQLADHYASESARNKIKLGTNVIKGGNIIENYDKK